MNSKYWIRLLVLVGLTGLSAGCSSNTNSNTQIAPAPVSAPAPIEFGFLPDTTKPFTDCSIAKGSARCE